jgi:hypothetical protein
MLQCYIVTLESSFAGGWDIKKNASFFEVENDAFLWTKRRLFDEFLADYPEADFAFRNPFFQPIGANEPVVLDIRFHIVELE